jgi:hypothetical protein
MNAVIGCRPNPSFLPSPLFPLLTSDHYTHFLLPARTATASAAALARAGLPVAAEILQLLPQSVGTGNLAAAAACRSRLAEERSCRLVEEGRPCHLVRSLGVGRGGRWGGQAFGGLSLGGSRLGLGGGFVSFVHCEREEESRRFGEENRGSVRRRGGKDLRGIMPAGMPPAMPNGGGGTPPIGELLVCV